MQNNKNVNEKIFIKVKQQNKKSNSHPVFIINKSARITTNGKARYKRYTHNKSFNWLS